MTIAPHARFFFRRIAHNFALSSSVQSSGTFSERTAVSLLICMRWAWRNTYVHIKTIQIRSLPHPGHSTTSRSNKYGVGNIWSHEVAGVIMHSLLILNCECDIFASIFRLFLKTYICPPCLLLPVFTFLQPRPLEGLYFHITARLTQDRRITFVLLSQGLYTTHLLNDHQNMPYDVITEILIIS